MWRHQRPTTPSDSIFVPAVYSGTSHLLTQTGLVGGIVTISTIGPQILAAPPYLWGQKVGLVNVGALIGTFLGFIYTALIADWSIKKSARSTHGMAEAEARLPLIIPSLFLATTGMWVFGFCAGHPSPNAWVGLEVGYGMICFGLMMVPSVGFNYVGRTLISSSTFVQHTKQKVDSGLLQRHFWRLLCSHCVSSCHSELFMDILCGHMVS